MSGLPSWLTGSYRCAEDAVQEQIGEERDEQSNEKGSCSKRMEQMILKVTMIYTYTINVPCLVCGGACD